MIEFLKNWVLTITTLVLFIVLLEIIVPSGKIKKFINLVSGFILIISIINPFLGMFRNGIDLKQMQIADSNFIDKSEIEKDSKVLKDNQMKQIANTFRNKVIYDVEGCLSDIKGIIDIKGDVIINEDYKADTFGEIKRIYVNFRLKDEENKIETIAKVEKVKIGGGDKTEKTIKPDKKLKDEIEAKINKLLGVDKEDIVINIIE
jgi:stage III sporulation protein AF